ncbi:hypothetical protein MO973_06785 [Paenibacillus sp. TRM 82003]|nr:hypothetical protein [Paenibacillus sp. TRM 82003]
MRRGVNGAAAKRGAADARAAGAPGRRTGRLSRVAGVRPAGRTPVYAAASDRAPLHELPFARQYERRYLAGLLRSRRAVTRILGCVADLAERDDTVARLIAERPESLEALARCVDGVPWASPRRRVHTRPGVGCGTPYLTQR